jgi:hypothetical protein
MNNPDNRKDQRRQKFLSKPDKKNEYSEEQRFVSKSKKEMKRRMEDIRGDELWEDWENPDNE